MLSRGYYDLTNGLGNESILQIIVIHLVIRIWSNYRSLLMLLIASTLIIPTIITQHSFAQVASQKEKVVLTAIFVQLDNNREMGKPLLDRALAKLKLMYPNLDIRLNYVEYPSNQIRFQILKALNHTTAASGSIDLISFDQIWLGEFAKKGLLTDLQIIPRIGVDKMTGTKRIGMVEYTAERCMEYGHGLILEEYGTGKT